jgi:hypothetical protein
MDTLLDVPYMYLTSITAAESIFPMPCKFDLFDVIPLNLDQKLSNKDWAIHHMVHVYAVHEVPNEKQPGI